MAYVPLRVSIPEPCHASWEEMTPAGANARHCGSCAKNVTDFSWMTDREIHQYLRVAGDGVCGRFRPDQLQRPIRAAVLPATGWRAVAAATGLLFAAGTVAQQIELPVIMGEIAVPIVEQTIGPAPVETIPAEARAFRGRVIDETGRPLIGVSVLIEGTRRGTATDLEGRFALRVLPGQRLQLSYVGYEMHHAIIRESDAGYTSANQTFRLLPAANRLETVEVTGYAPVQGRVAIMGAVSTVSAEESLTCTSSAVTIEPSPTTGAEQWGTNTDLTVFPNPYVDRITVSFFAEDAGAVSAELFAADGRRLMVWPAQAHEAGRVEVDLPVSRQGLPTGHHVLRLTDAGGEVSSRIVEHLSAR